MTGQTVLHYEVKELLGEGGMGVVYKALDLKLNRLVALKFLPPGLAASVETRERFAQEATALSLLNHPHIATLFDIQEVESRRFLVLEYLPGGTLKARMDALSHEGKRLSIDEVLEYAKQTAEGLAHAHRRGIIHRDIKTSNLMLTEEGQLKITDFGVAKLSRFGGSTTPGSLIGTVRYMSPEQTEGKDIDARSDIFSVGVVLFELTTGRMPFEAESQQALLVKIATLQAPALSAFRPDVPAELERIVAKMMMKRPSARYQSVDNLIVDLESLRGGALGRTWTKTSKSAKSTILNAPRRPWIFAAVAALVASLASVYFYSHGPPSWTQLRPLPGEKKLAVLPFHSAGDNRLDDAFCTGLFEIVAGKLGQLDRSNFRVISPREVIRQQVESAVEAHKAFAATLALKATLKRSDDNFTALLELIDPSNAAVLRTGQVEIAKADLSGFPDMLVERAAAMLKVSPAAPEITLSAGMTLKPEAYELFWTGRGLLQRYDRVENLEKAIETFNKALALDPQFALAHAGKAEAYLRRYRATKTVAFLGEARASCQRALALNQQLSAIHSTMGMVHISAGEYEDAIISFETALKLQRENPDVIRELANAYVAANRNQAAEEMFRRAVQRRPDDWSAHRDLGVFYNGIGKLDKAISSLLRVVELTPDNYEGYRNLGGVYLRAGDYENAKVALNKSLGIRPTGAAYMNLGALYYHQKEFALAVAAFEQATKLNPDLASTWGDLADAYRLVPGKEAQSNQAYERAIALLEKDLKVNPNPQARANLAMYWSKRGDNKRALSEIEAARNAKPNDGFILSRAVLVFEQAQLRKEALAAFEGAAQLGYRKEMEHWPPLDDLRKDPRYQEVISRCCKKRAEEKALSK